MTERQEHAIKRDYYCWLYDKIENERLDAYGLVLKMLHQKEFYFVHAMDENRAADGKVLRDRYIYEKTENPKTRDELYEILSGPATMLEVMIGLTERMDAEVYIPAEGIREEYVDSFWELFRNLGLDAFTDSSFVDNWNETILDKKLTTVLDRKYKRDGEGGFFPLKGQIHDDQRKVEIWYQMQAYLIENYPIEGRKGA